MHSGMNMPSPSAIQLCAFVAWLLLFWNMEIIFGLTRGVKKNRHLFTNAKFIFTNAPLQILLGLLFVKTLNWIKLHHFGIGSYLLDSNRNFFHFAVVFLLLDLGEYFYHRLMHKINRLWRFHAIHHSDRIVDASTTFREHPGEALIRNGFTLIWVVLSGASFQALFFRQFIQNFFTVFSHVNFRLPEKVDAMLNKVFITPNLHQVHHHYLEPYTDSNYGDVLSIWDRIFGTYKEYPKAKVVFGLDSHMDINQTTGFFRLLARPFKK